MPLTALPTAVFSAARPAKLFIIGIPVTDASIFRISLNHIEGSACGEGGYTKKGVRSYLFDSLSDVLKGLTFIHEVPIQGLHEVGFNLSIGNIDYPDVVAQAVEKKLAAMQLLQEKETQKEIAQKDAEIRIEEAKGIAQAQRIINATLTENYLQHEAINAQRAMASSPNHTTVYIPVGSNGIPIVYTASGK